MHEPFYELEIKTANCFVEISVNDLPIFSNYEMGGMAVDYPINEAILKSGNQLLEIKMIATEDGAPLSKYASCEVKVFVKEANKEASGRQLVHEVPMVDRKEKELPVFLQKTSFMVKVPYQNEGWQHAVDLKTFDQDLLRKELHNALQKILSIYNSRNESEYKKLYKERGEEHNKSFYLTHEEIKENDDSIFHGLPEKIESINTDLYQLVFYGNNKLVSLQAKHQPPGFVFESTNKDEYGFTEMVLFYKKTKDAVITVIR